MSDTDSATKAKNGTDHGFKGDVGRLGQYVGQLHEDLAGIAKTSGDVLHSGVAAAKESGLHTLEAARVRRERATVTLRKRMVDHPGATLGIAVGVGILLGLAGPAIIRSQRKPS